MSLLKYITNIVVPLGYFLRTAHMHGPFQRVPLLISRIMPTFFFFWLFSFIPYVGGLIYFLGFTSLSAYFHIQERKITHAQEKAHIFLWYYTVVIIGFGSLWAFIGHAFMAEIVAKSIGWVPSPFQTELAFYHLGFAFVGLMAIWTGKKSIMPIIIAKSVFWYGAALVHIYDLIEHGNYSINNIGAPLIGDLVYPTLLLALLAFVFDQKKKPSNENNIQK